MFGWLNRRRRPVDPEYLQICDSAGNCLLETTREELAELIARDDGSLRRAIERAEILEREDFYADTSASGGLATLRGLIRRALEIKRR